jgi:hypothetical protein
MGNGAVLSARRNSRLTQKTDNFGANRHLAFGPGRTLRSPEIEGVASEASGSLSGFWLRGSVVNRVGRQRKSALLKYSARSASFGSVRDGQKQKDQ